jgi:hypothetical protein
MAQAVHWLICLLVLAWSGSGFFLPGRRVGSWSSQSGSSSLLSSSGSGTQIPLLSPRLNGSFAAFQDAEDLILVVQQQQQQGQNPSSYVRSFFQPRALANATDAEIWQWWQDRKMAERVLKSAISSSKSDLGPYFDEYKRFLVADKAEVLQAQDDFFRAMHNADFDVMRTLWLDSNETLCLPPGSDFFYTGTENVLAYWAAALTTPRPYITIRNVKLNWQGDVAIVSCLMDSGRPQRRSGGAKQGQGARSREVHVTNIFVRRAGSDVYKLSAHIASTSAASQGPQQLAYLQETYTDPLRAKKRSSRGGGMGVGVGMMGFDGSFGGGQGMGGPVTIEALLQQLADPDGAGQSGSFSDDGDEYSNDDEEEGEDEEDNGQEEFYGGGDENDPRNGFFDEQEDDSFFRDQLHSSFGQGPGGGGSVQSDVRGNRGGRSL